MYHEDAFDEITTVEEDIEKLLREIDRDISLGKLQAACSILEDLEKDGEQYHIIQATPQLCAKYTRLSQHCTRTFESQDIDS